MPIHEIRESIEFDNINLGDASFGIVQKEINLKEGVAHKMLQCDAYLDNPFFGTTEDDVIIELMVTPHPVIYTNMPIGGYGFRAPSASLDTVLFKQTMYKASTAISETTITEFPNQFINARPTFTWYTPRLYLTLLIHGPRGADVSNFALTVYCAVEHKRASTITYGMGLMREYQVAQVAAVVSNGRFISPARNVGQIFPMWKHGGIRPELMMKSDAFAQFFYNSSNNDSSKMVDPFNLRIFATLGRQMVPNPDAFGTPNTVKGDIPDWVTFALPEGIEAGPIRDQWPPIKHADNGNTLCL
ncbi:unnamed protein product [marine sediment metagenome]|uniref:Uncharacterized protein n=1 Tax=marine sediment metagenome TaxID=412755 RepID=X0Z6B7_9ZZZZ